MSSNTTLSAAARGRMLAFNGLVWILGLAVIVVVGVAVFARAGAEVEAAAGEDYTYEPWLNPDPPVADDEGDGVYSGVDGAVIRLEGLDPQQPLLIIPHEDAYVSGIRVTGPGGETVVEGEYGEPPRFDLEVYGEGIWVVVPQPDVELFIDGLRDERWRLTIATPAVQPGAGTMSGFGNDRFLVAGDATTARVSTRGAGHVRIDAVSATGDEELLWEEDGVDRSIAWADGDPVLLVVDASDDLGWVIEFAEPAPTPTATPAATEAGAP